MKPISLPFAPTGLGTVSDANEIPEKAKESPTLLLEIPEYVNNWDHYFLYQALVASIKSKDPRSRVGAAIVSPDNLVIATGFNGLARGAYDDQDILDNKDEKLRVICHAEVNAIYNASRIGVPLAGASIYVTKFPCLTCCNAIIQAGIQRIYTHDESYWSSDPFDADHSRKKELLHQAKIQVDAPFHPDYSPHVQIKAPKHQSGTTTDGEKKGPTRATDAGGPGQSTSGTDSSEAI